MGSASLRLLPPDEAPESTVVDFAAEARKRMTPEQVKQELDRLWQIAEEKQRAFRKMQRAHLTIVK